MSDADNTLSQVVAGDSPQPFQKEQSDYDGLQSSVEDAIDDSSPEDKINQAEASGKITEAQAAQLKKTLKIKVDGQEFEEVIDFNDEESLKRHIQKAKAFDKRNNEFASYKSQVDKLLQKLQSDPESVMEELGYNLDEYAEKRLAKKIEELKKSPEQIEREKMEKELNELKAEKKRIEQERQQAEMERVRNETAQQIELEISEALGSAKSILPQKNPIVLQRIAQTMLMAMNNGYPNVTAKDVIPLVEKQWQQELNEFFSVTPEETLERLVGKSNLDRYRKKIVASKRQQTQTATPKQIIKDTGIKREEPVETEVSLKAKKEKFRKMFYE